MTIEPNDPTPTWTDPAPTAQIPTPMPAVPTPATEAALPAPSAPVSPVVPVGGGRRAGGAWVNVLLGVAALVAVGGVAFAVGRSTAPTTAGAGILPGTGGLGGGFAIDPNASFEPGDGFGGAGRPGAGGPGFVVGGGLAIEGEVTAVDGSTLTIKLASGDTTTITLDEATTYHEATPSEASDVAVGDDVSVTVSMDGVPGGGAGGGTPSLTAADVTVTR